MKSDKMLYIVYAGLEYLIKKIDECENNPENFSTSKIGEHIPCGDSISRIWGVWSCRKQAYFMLRKRLYNMQKNLHVITCKKYN